MWVVKYIVLINSDNDVIQEISVRGVQILMQQSTPRTFIRKSAMETTRNYLWYAYQLTCKKLLFNANCRGFTWSSCVSGGIAFLKVVPFFNVCSYLYVNVSFVLSYPSHWTMRPQSVYPGLTLRRKNVITYES